MPASPRKPARRPKAAKRRRKEPATRRVDPRVAAAIALALDADDAAEARALALRAPPSHWVTAGLSRRMQPR